MDYDEEYYRTLGAKVYDVTRPIRKAFRRGLLIIPPTSTIVSFAFGNYMQMDRLRKVCEHVNGYEINPAAVKDAEAHGYEGMVWLQDCAVDFEPKVRGLLSISYYLGEHLTDDQFRTLCRNMQRHSPLNLIVVTTAEDENYAKDPTHCNAKNHAQWGKVFKSAYPGWTRIWTDRPGRFCFADASATTSIASLTDRLKYLRDTWTTK